MCKTNSAFGHHFYKIPKAEFEPQALAAMDSVAFSLFKPAIGLPYPLCRDSLRAQGPTGTLAVA
jgi:hypothetical protein